MVTNIKRGDICYVNLDGAVGSEQGNNRVCVVLQNDVGNMYSPTTIIAPLTSQIKRTNLPTHVVIKKNWENGLSKDSMVLCEQVRTVDKRRIQEVFGNVGAEIGVVFNAYVASFGTL